MINQFISQCESQDKSPHTISGYQTELKKFETWLEETAGETLDRVTDLDIKDYRQYLLTVKGQKPATVNRGLKVLSMFYNYWSVGQGLIQYNPTTNIKLVQVQQAAPRWLDRNELNKLKRTVLLERNPVVRARDYAILLLMAEAGLRVFELEALKVSDLTISERKGLVVIKKGKGSKYREVPLNKNVRQALNEYLKLRGADGEKLLLGQRGPMTKRAIQHRMEKYRENAQIEVTAHQLRHTFCHELIKEGKGIQVVAQLAGHANINTTRIYTTPSERELMDAVESLTVE